MTNLLQLSNLETYYGPIMAIHGVSLLVAEGSITSVLGANGAGKTTVLKTISGAMEPLKGTVVLSGNEIQGVDPDVIARLGVAHIPEGREVFPFMTVEENLLMGAFSRTDSDIKSDVDLVFSYFPALSSLRATPAVKLSGGQQQRVAVARSLVFDPQLVLMDEPLGALDKNLRESMQYEIKHIHENIGVTVVYVTHDQSEALTMSNRIAVFNDGKVQQLSSPDELYEKPVNSFVAEFIGENNTFVGEVSDISGGKCKVKIANTDILANPISVKGKGEKTKISLRPERALINPSDQMDNIHSGKIEEVIYHGDHTRVRINLLGNNQFILKVPNSSANLDIKLGKDIKIGWNSEDARALDPS